MAESLNKLFTGGNYQLPSQGGLIGIARVTKVIYGPQLPDGTTDLDYEGITSIGAIKYVLLNSAQTGTKTGNTNKIARPAFAFVHHYPTEGEFVYLIQGPSLELNSEANAPDYYYLPPFGLWRATNHNALPNLAEYASIINRQVINYDSSQEGLTNKPNGADEMTYPLGNNFVELQNVKSVQPFVGDVIFEGRYGQSIRFGSSNLANTGQNAWASSSREGDPIIIIRNGQGVQANNVGYEVTVENIDVDQSSIYLTAGQFIFSSDIPGSYPLTSWNVVNTEKQQNAVVAGTTLPVISSDSMSPKEQDRINLTLS